MNPSRIARSPIKDHQKTSLSISKHSPISKIPKKSHSEINIRKKSQLNNLHQELESLKQKIEASKGILSTIYSKVKKKESHYENQITKKDLYLHRAKQMVKDYKNLYEDGLKDMENFIDQNRAQTFQRNQNHLSKARIQELKRNALQKAKEKSLEVSNSQINHKKKESQSNLQKSKISQAIMKKMADQVPIKKMKKSHSAIYQNKDKPKIQKPKTQKQQKNSRDQPLNARKQSESKIVQSRFSKYQKQEQPIDEKKTLYEIYKERILKRQKQQNSQKMSWIVEKLQENLNDLQLIRKKSQLQMSKYSPQSQNQQSLSKKSKIQNAKSFDRNHRDEKHQKQKISKQSSKQKLLELNKRKLERIKEQSLK